MLLVLTLPPNEKSDEKLKELPTTHRECILHNTDYRAGRHTHPAEQGHKPKLVVIN